MNKETIKSVLLGAAVIVIFLLLGLLKSEPEIKYVACLNCNEEFPFIAETYEDEYGSYPVYHLKNGCGYCRADDVVGEGVVKLEDVYEQLGIIFENDWEADYAYEVICEKAISGDEFCDLMDDVWK